MTLILKNEEMAGLLSMPPLIQDMEEAFRELAEGTAIVPPRWRVYFPLEPMSHYYWFNGQTGVVPKFRAAALRVDSSFYREVVREGQRRHEFPGDFVGLVLLFDIDTCRLLSIMDDHYLSPLRVAATCGVGVRYLARPDAQVLGLFGTGEQARAHLMAVCSVRDIKLVKVFSPTPEHRRRFAKEMTSVVKVEIKVAENNREVVQGADIVVAATNSRTAVLDGSWLEKGAHVVSTVGGDILGGQFSKGDELDRLTWLRSSSITITYRQKVESERPGILGDLLTSGELTWEKIYELGEVITGKAKGRASSEDITVHKNLSAGIQFAVAAKRVYEAAKAKGIGRELPDEFFMTKRGEQAWSP